MHEWVVLFIVGLIAAFLVRRLTRRWRRNGGSETDDEAMKRSATRHEMDRGKHGHDRR